MASSARLAALFACWLAPIAAHGASAVLPGLTNSLACYYDFEHPVATNAVMEEDLGFSGTPIHLVNGGAAMRTNDGAFPGSSQSLQTQQVNPTTSGNDDWKAGIYNADGVGSLSAFGSVTGITLMGWVKPTGENPGLNSVTATPGDYYNAVGLFGLLSGTSEGHLVRALIEIISVNNQLRLVALGRRLDNGSSLVLAATNDWSAHLPKDTWTHLTATFDFDNGVMALYRNGQPLPAEPTTTSDAWNVIGGDEPDATSASNPTGIKIGGSFPQNTLERNPFNGRLDDLMFFNRVLTESEVSDQYAHFFSMNSNSHLLAVRQLAGNVILSWPVGSKGFALESRTELGSGDWESGDDSSETNGQEVSVSLPVIEAHQFFRLRRD